jgi:hypothetical protein
MDSSSSHVPAGRLAKVYLALRRILRRMFGLSSGWIRKDGYKPERHYMRGPGPKTLSRQNSRERASSTS